jgi:hypothetical protein
MNYCPCCNDKLLRQIGKTGIYWFCPYCRQEMPVLCQSLEHKIRIIHSTQFCKNQVN